MDQVKNILYSIIEPLLQPETYQSLLSNLIMIIVYVVAAWIILHFVNKGIAQFFKIQNKSKNGNKKRSKTLISLVQNVVSYVVWFIVLTTILSKFGISVGGIIASAGVVGLAVGFGAQTVVKDIITGFFIIFENQFDVGDYVKISNSGAPVAEGTVKSIGLRSMRINTISGELTTLPNGSVGEITNYSVINGEAIVEIPVSITEDIDKVEDELNDSFEAIRSKYYLFISTPEVVGINSITNNEIVLRISAETIPGEGFTGARILRKEILKLFKLKEIKMPQPMMVQYEANQQNNA
ncbi:mechanosensitive ion channel family protein [Staphylococcus pseudoxylosus]|uniref:mechanosensitive ion channel family protein n=1 Tax=Staphylococcus pseudoxylosus TaxID=2282419 RepID=UPI000D1DAAF8|nr:mechanosensitive ion channel family protein [Staphylococcus pseudoxylosus]PTI59022.1 mechanosensitive ion channel protein MscS [Staphylococcus xylosus]MDW8797291.1 mechanosensitive ion channel family protein [Staphylococcus pseudoxylosus]MEB6036321.1 mechanosensitive ion channel family protein [Staphylococcus pseudoxylosus]MEB6044595.1 mechanosensitive ion channel family protein [Staphylococcus pseudoxylosus]MEB6061081.1 mechanosensitive ion channel family protein [Staphylococcus pseudoxylo